MITRKLYWADAYRRHFTARVLHIATGDHPHIILNRSLFYPTGGGQPHDTGTLDEARVLDVIALDDAILHIVDHLPARSDDLHGRIDWQRRWYHMQQHSGQHLLSAVCETHLQRPTIGFHLSDQSLTIDLPGPVPAEAELAEIMAHTQAIIHEDRPIRSHIFSPQQALALDLRKTPDVHGPVRIVEIEGTDRCACGGTHVHSTAAIGSIVISKAERRGDQTRLHFVCGNRAVDDHLRLLAVTQQLGDQLTTGLDALPAAVASLQSDLQQAQRSLRNAQNQLAQNTAVALWSNAPRMQGIRLIRHALDDADPKSLDRLAGQLTTQGNCIALLAWQGPRPRWMIARSVDVAFDLSRLTPLIRAQQAVKGGGSAHTLQGGASSSQTLQELFDILIQYLTEHLSA